MIAEQLKRAILQAAIQGKLTEQLAEDGDARDLLKEIQEEKAHLIKEGKIKNGKPLPEISEDEIPFDIPENWCWVRLGSISFNHGQKKPDKEFTYIDISSINNKENMLGKFNNVLEPGDAPSRARKIVYQGDVIYATVRPYLHNICIIDRNIHPEPIVSTGFAVICTPKPLLNNYLFHCFLSPMFDSYVNDNDNSKGVAYPAINDDKFSKALIPLPPLSEQNRIVERIDALLPEIDKLKNDETKLDALQKAFTKKMKDSILQYAIQGKLTVQLLEDGDARDLLKEIQKEKARLVKEGKVKKEKPLREISEDEIPFDIPENWCWVRLGEILEVKGGKRIPVGKKLSKTDTGHKYIRVADMHNETILDTDIHYVPSDVFPLIKNYTISSDDVYITVAGSIGRVGTIPKDFDCANLTENADKLVFEIIDKHWLTRTLQSPFVQTQIIGYTTKVGQPKLAIKRIENFVIPLIPFAEQHRIVERLEHLLPLCETLE